MTKDVFDRLYREHGHAVLRRARRMLRSEEDARDVVQDVFLAIYKSPESFESRSSVATYLYAAATNACLNRIRNHKTRTRLVAVETAAWGNQATPRSEDRALACEILEGLSDEDAALAAGVHVDRIVAGAVARYDQQVWRLPQQVGSGVIVRRQFVARRAGT